LRHENGTKLHYTADDEDKGSLVPGNQYVVKHAAVAGNQIEKA
jgi:hypothetical protein